MELEESINIYERGEALKDHCDRLLKQAEAKVEKLTFNPAGRADRNRAVQATGVGRSASCPQFLTATLGYRDAPSPERYSYSR